MDVLVFGGTFDPPHAGHLRLLSSAMRRLDPDQALVVPAFISPLKGEPRAGAPAREAMLRAALEGLPAAQRRRTKIFRFELERGRRTYTYELLRELSRRRPGDRLNFLIGSDGLLQFRRWKRWREVASRARLVVGRRPGFSAASEARGLDVLWLGGTFPDLSSTALRRRLALGEDVSKLVGKKVQARAAELYGGGLRRWLEANLSPERLRHSLAVADLASRLAEAHGLDADRALLAGLLHDAGRSMSPAELAVYAVRRRLPAPRLKETARRQPLLLHSYAGARIARERFGVRDREVLKAVAHHTLGAPRMGALERLIYVADVCSEDRGFSAARGLRALAFKNPDAAFFEAARLKLTHVLSGGRWLHPAGLRLWNELSTAN